MDVVFSGLPTSELPPELPPHSLQRRWLLLITHRESMKHCTGVEDAPLRGGPHKFPHLRRERQIGCTPMQPLPLPNWRVGQVPLPRTVSEGNQEAQEAPANAPVVEGLVQECAKDE
jgi:hypothetical protein